MSYDQDQTLTELRSRIQTLKEQRNNIMNEVILQRKETQLMQTQMGKMKKEKAYLDGLLKEKISASRDYDRIIG